jgi:hypothetical protein
MAYKGPFPYTNTGVTNQILVSGTTFSGSIVNSGTVGAGGIVVISSTFQSGGIVDVGTIVGGIKIDSHSTIAGGGTAVAVIDTATFGGGIIRNSGAIKDAAQAAQPLLTHPPHG